MKFDPRNDWSEWQTLYGFVHIGNRERHYITYGGGPEGGIMKRYGDGWYIWHRTWGERIQYMRKPDELELICRNGDGHEAMKVVFMGAGGYEVGDDEYDLDDLEDNLDWRYRTNETDDEREGDESEEEDMDSD